MARIRRSNCNEPGISRRRRGRGFSYHLPDGSLVDDPEVLSRIRALAIPPAWNDVWICTWPNGHLQATGMDNAGRRQYRYHDDWRKRRDVEKFERVREFGRVLPSLRQTVERDLQRRGLGKRRVVAAAVRLLDIGYFRVGGEQYAEENDTYGVATLLKDHVRRQGDRFVFDYDAKGSKMRFVEVDDPMLLPVLERLKRRRSGGDCLLAWKRQDHWVDVTSADINAYIKAAAGDGFSAKDFRTWSATVLAAVGLAEVADECTNRTTRTSGRAH
jgi:DNA topoisomerase-1